MISSKAIPSTDEQIVLEGPTPFDARVSRIESHIARGVLVLEMAREPRTVNEFHTQLGIPIASTHRLVKALLKLGWLRIAGSRVVFGGHGALGPAKLYVSTSPRLPVFPHPCGDCRMTLYSPEHEALHRCR